jgi:hypothetical protein
VGASTKRRTELDARPPAATGASAPPADSREERIAATRARLGPEGLRAAHTVWFVVNAVCILQAIGFASRPFAPEVNPALGLVIALLAVPATWALAVFLTVRAGWLFAAGPIVFDAFVIVMLLVERLIDVEWRDPMRVEIAIPYLVLFFGSIVLMGLPMLRIEPRRWLVTVATTATLLLAMLYAIAMGVG